MRGRQLETPRGDPALALPAGELAALAPRPADQAARPADQGLALAEILAMGAARPQPDRGRQGRDDDRYRRRCPGQLSSDGLLTLRCESRGNAIGGSQSRPVMASNLRRRHTERDLTGESVKEFFHNSCIRDGPQPESLI